MDFNMNLYYLRKKKGLSQEDLALKLNVARQTVSKWELGDTIPDMDKLIALSKIFEVSIDELVGKSDIIEESNIAEKPGQRKIHYEYASSKKLFGLPLIHINIGFGIYKAKGIIAIGNISFGLISIGILALGLLCFGPLAIGVLSLASVALGIFSFGGIAFGIVAIGGISIGIISIGGVAIGLYSIGGVAVAKNIAYGGVAYGNIAIGDKTYGNYLFHTENGRAFYLPKELRETIETAYPHLWKWIVNLFCTLS